MTFTNVYEANGEANVSATKSLNGRTLGNEQFEFTLTAEDGAPMPDAAGTENSYTVKNEASGSLVLEGTKTMKSESLSEFSFNLEDEKGNVLQTVANDTSTGKFAFEALEFSQNDLTNGSATFTPA